MLDQRCALALNVARQELMHLSLAEFKVLVRDQFFVLQLEPRARGRRARVHCAETDARKELLKQTRAIANAGGPDRSRGRPPGPAVAGCWPCRLRSDGSSAKPASEPSPGDKRPRLARPGVCSHADYR